jgi:serine/threonine-protein kinase ULK4
VLNYLQTICCDVSMANVIVNAPVTELLVRMLASARHPALRIRLACVLGLLVRYCTFIDDEVYATGECKAAFNYFNRLHEVLLIK